MSEFDALYQKIVRISKSAYHARIKKRLLYSWNRIYSLIKPESTVVEIGIGPMAVLVKKLVGARVIGIDLNDSQISLCDNFDIDLRICDVQVAPLPLEDESTDIILLLELIEHLCMYPNDLFDEIYKKVKKGGYLVVSTVNFLRFSNRVRVLLGKSPLINYFERTEEGRNHIREFIPNEMEYYLTKSGFNVTARHLFGIPEGKGIVLALLHLAYLYPWFRNYFIIIAKK